MSSGWLGLIKASTPCVKILPNWPFMQQTKCYHCMSNSVIFQRHQCFMKHLHWKHWISILLVCKTTHSLLSVPTLNSSYFPIYVLLYGPCLWRMIMLKGQCCFIYCAYIESQQSFVQARNPAVNLSCSNSMLSLHNQPHANIGNTCYRSYLLASPQFRMECAHIEFDLFPDK